MGRQRVCWVTGVVVAALVVGPATGTTVPFVCQSAPDGVEGMFTPEQCPLIAIEGRLPVRVSVGDVVTTSVRVTNHGSRPFSPMVTLSVPGRGVTSVISPVDSVARRRAVSAYRTALARHRAAPTSATLAAVRTAIRTMNLVRTGADGFRPVVLLDRTGVFHQQAGGGVVAPGRSTIMRWRWRIDRGAAPGRRDLDVTLYLPSVTTTTRVARVPVIVTVATVPARG